VREVLTPRGGRGKAGEPVASVGLRGTELRLVPGTAPKLSRAGAHEAPCDEIPRGSCGMMKAMKPATTMVDGPEAFTTFKTAMKKILTVPKSALPPSPFKKWVPKKKKEGRSK